ncbi:hypothetical protein ASE66_07005 [Bosea sp. Root483D1]|uniref:hypothetical protein n=1 Tax=Bosea sp. Root483D1 TaxID=1736544 RepID=UPI00071020E1|nr:hypothetical protein [Bosea sp. Root483D1]KRE20600.1 hypothetical protein ASE66_07005 [Bosea sp. Root483D1]
MRLNQFLSGCALSIACLVASQAAPAADRLQGAWVTDATTCDTVFSKRNGQFTLKRDAEGWSGFIVSGKRVRGTNASCNLVSSKQKGDVLTFLLNCADKMIFQTVSVSVRFESDDRIVRFDPEFPEVETTYKRCSR